MEYLELGSACDDCTIAIANDDYSGMSDAEESRVKAGLERLSAVAPHGLIVGEDQGFMHSRCDVCGALPGGRHEVGYLVEEKPVIAPLSDILIAEIKSRTAFLAKHEWPK